jgi:predicted lipid-binding transport protein (Tim44 family)
MDLTTLLFLGLAIFVAWRLRSVLGKRTGTENPPEMWRNQHRGGGPVANNDKVVPLPTRNNGARPDQAPPPLPEQAETPRDPLPGVKSGSPLAAALQAVMQADRTFEPKHFLGGARMAYEMIVQAFAQGDRNTLKPLLSKEVFDGFDGAIRDRDAAKHTVESSFVGIDKADIVEAAVRGGTAQVTVRFVSKLISATRDQTGAVVEGDPTRVTEVTDVWTFARDVSARDPNWRLVATEAA